MRRNGSSARRAFSLTDLMVLLAVVAMLLAILPAARRASRKRSDCVKCASNLRQIAQGLALYGNNFRKYPRTAWNPSQPCKAEFDNAGFDSDDGKMVTPNNVTAAFFLLVRHCDLNPEVFVCPASMQVKDALGGMAADKRSNFTSADNISYSFTNPYPTTSGGVRVGYKWSQNVPANWAIAADRNDGTRDPTVHADSPVKLQRPLNSSNHGDGQMVLFIDGHAEWATTPWVGADRDNIYTRMSVAQTPTGGIRANPTVTAVGGFPEPAYELDSVLVPIFPTPPPALLVMTWLVHGPGKLAAALLIFVLVAAVIIRSRRNRAAPGA